MKKSYGSYLSFNRTQPIKVPKQQKISYKSSIQRKSMVFHQIDPSAPPEDIRSPARELGKIEEQADELGQTYKEGIAEKYTINRPSRIKDLRNKQE